MCNPLMMYPEIFKKWFLDMFETLAADKVVNVRISLAIIISNHIKAAGPLSNDGRVLEIVEKLKLDKSRDVRSLFVPEEYVPQQLAVVEVQPKLEESKGDDDTPKNITSVIETTELVEKATAISEAADNKEDK